MNRIPRKFDHIIVETVHGTSAGEVGRRFKVTKDPYSGYLGVDLVNGKRWSMFVSHLRNPEIYKIVEIIA